MTSYNNLVQYIKKKWSSSQKYFQTFYCTLEHLMRKITTWVLWLSIAQIIELFGGFASPSPWFCETGAVAISSWRNSGRGWVGWHVARAHEKACDRNWKQGSHTCIPCNADKGWLVINWSLSQWMALLYLLHQQPTAELSGAAGRAPTHTMGCWPVLCAPPTLVCKCSLWFPLFTYPRQGLGWIQQ